MNSRNPSKRHLDARWNNAVRIANKVNKLISDGYHVFDEYDEKVFGFEIVEGEGVYLKYNELCSSYIYFLKDPSFDNGALDTIEEYNQKFSEWYFIHPKNIRNLGVCRQKQSV